MEKAELGSAPLKSQCCWGKGRDGQGLVLSQSSQVSGLSVQWEILPQKEMWKVTKEDI